MLGDTRFPETVAAAQLAQKAVNANPDMLRNMTLTLQIVWYNNSDQLVRGTMQLLTQTGRKYVTGLISGVGWRDSQATVTLAKPSDRPTISMATNTRLEPEMIQGLNLPSVQTQTNTPIP